MKRSYVAPLLIEFGSLSQLTGIFQRPGSGDVLLTTSGQVTGTGSGSIDACAEDDGKCKCEDNQTC